MRKPCPFRRRRDHRITSAFGMRPRNAFASGRARFSLHRMPPPPPFRSGTSPVTTGEDVIILHVILPRCYGGGGEDA